MAPLRSVRRFFFAPEGVRPLALVRIGLALAMLCEAAAHWPHAVELYSTAGPVLPMFVRSEIVPGAPLGEDGRFPRRIVGEFHPPVPGPRLAIVLATARIAALMFVLAGWQTRLSLILAWSLTLYLGLLDGTSFAKHTVIALHAMAILAFSRSHAVWSLDARTTSSLSPVFGGEGDVQSQTLLGGCPLGPAWPRRLIQIAVCHVYLGAALTKLRNPSFMTGDLLSFSLLDDAWGGGWLGHWVSTQRNLVVCLSLATVLFELLFPFLVWVRRARLAMLALAFLMHTGMLFLLHIGMFSPVMFAVLLAFLNERELRGKGRGTRDEGRGARGEAGEERVAMAESKIQNPKSKITPPSFLSPLPSPLSPLLVFALLVTCGYAWQWFRDDYGVFGRRVLPAPARLPPAAAAEMLWPQKPPFEHYLHHLELGARTSGSQVFGETHRFRSGTGIFVLTRFLVPHPALDLEGLLIAPEGTEVARFTQAVESWTPNIINGFELARELPPGDYTIVLQANGHEIARRDVDVIPP